MLVPRVESPAAVKFPEKKPLPWTARVVKGEVVPTPTLPPRVARYV